MYFLIFDTIVTFFCHCLNSLSICSEVVCNKFDFVTISQVIDLLIFSLVFALYTSPVSKDILERGPTVLLR